MNHPAPRRYNFYGRHLVLDLPPDIAHAWHLLYHHFECSGPPAGDSDCPPEIFICGNVDLRIGARIYTDESNRWLMIIQDYLQNEILATVDHLLLWHGAVWNVGGQGIVLLADSSVGKTTLTLGHLLQAGDVWSDEVAVWNPATSRLIAFPRSLAVLPPSMALCRVHGAYPAINLDETKLVVPLPVPPVAGVEIPCCAVVLLEWMDDPVEENMWIGEVSVLSHDKKWITAMSDRWPDVRLTPHPDGAPWWRCCRGEPLPGTEVGAVIQSAGAVLTGFHRSARRKPRYRGPPVIQTLSPSACAERALPFLLNGHHAARQWTAPRLLSMAREMMHPATCVRCIPGELEPTRQAILSLLT